MINVETVIWLFKSRMNKLFLSNGLEQEVITQGDISDIYFMVSHYKQSNTLSCKIVDCIYACYL